MRNRFTDETLRYVGVSNPKTWRPSTDEGLRDSLPVRPTFPTTESTGTKKEEDTVGETGTPLHVVNVSATESGYKTTDGALLSLVSVNFTPDPSDKFLSTVQVWFTNYHASSSPQLMCEGRESPISFLTETTKETVTVTVVAVGGGGEKAEFATAPTATVALDGVVSAPPAPTISQSLTPIPIGYQFAFNQVGSLAADVVDGYRIYCSKTANDPATAVPVDYVKHDPLNSGSKVYQDTAGYQVTWYYWISAVNTSALESAKVACQTGAVVSGQEAILSDPNLDNVTDGDYRMARTGVHSSYRPLTNPLTAVDSGSNSTTISVAPFTMRVGATDVDLNGGSIASLQYATIYFVYYDDPTIEGGTKTFHATTVKENALWNEGRFFVGSICTPAVGSGETVGYNDGGTGAQSGKTTQLFPASVTADGWTSPELAIDADEATFASVTTSGNNLSLEVYDFPSFYSWFSSNNLKMVYKMDSVATGQFVYVKMSQNDGESWTTIDTINAAGNTRKVYFPLSVLQDTSKVRVRFELPSGSGTNQAKTAGTAATDSAVGTVNWTNPSNATGAANQGWATAVGGDGTNYTYYLKLTNLGFTIPNTATIRGISATVTRAGDNTYTVEEHWVGEGYNPITGAYDPGHYEYTTIAQNVTDSAVKIIKGGAITGTNKASSSRWSSATETITYGGASDLWGTTWTYSDVNASNFGIAISAKTYCENSMPTSANIDSVTVTVYYSNGAGESSAKVYLVSQEVTM